MVANTPPGPGVDASGQAVVDPTKNVLDLVEAAIRRQDDLRDAEGRSVREILRTRDVHAGEMRLAEAARLDAIRSVDVEAVKRAADVQSAAASALATQVALSADAMRNQVATTATASATALATALAPLTDAIADLRRVQYEQAGSRAQTVETELGARQWVGIAVAIAAVLSAFLVGVAGIVVTLLLR